MFFSCYFLFIGEFNLPLYHLVFTWYKTTIYFLLLFFPFYPGKTVYFSPKNHKYMYKYLCWKHIHTNFVLFYLQINFIFNLRFLVYFIYMIIKMKVLNQNLLLFLWKIPRDTARGLESTALHQNRKWIGNWQYAWWEWAVNKADIINSRKLLPFLILLQALSIDAVHPDTHRHGYLEWNLLGAASLHREHHRERGKKGFRWGRNFKMKKAYYRKIDLASLK